MELFSLYDEMTELYSSLLTTEANTFIIGKTSSISQNKMHNIDSIGGSLSDENSTNMSNIYFISYILYLSLLKA